MNLLLLGDGDRTPDGADRFTVEGRRAEHLVGVLRVGVGQPVRVGMIDGDIGTAEVIGVPDAAAQRGIDARVELRVVRWESPPPLGRDVLVLAVPRPKVLRRMLAAATALGFAEIHCTRSWRVEKSHLDSRVLDPVHISDTVRLGLEQSQRTMRPLVRVHRRFMECLDVVGASLPEARFVGHPPMPNGSPKAPAELVEAGAVASRPLVAVGLARGAPFALALGPDGGFVAREVETLAERGFAPVYFSPFPQRTETALAAMWGQLEGMRGGPMAQGPIA